MTETMGLFDAEVQERRRADARVRAGVLRTEYEDRARVWAENVAACEMCGDVRHLRRGVCCCCWDSVTGWSAAHGEHVCSSVRSRYGHLLRDAARLDRIADGWPVGLA